MATRWCVCARPFTHARAPARPAQARGVGLPLSCTAPHLLCVCVFMGVCLQDVPPIIVTPMYYLISVLRHNMFFLATVTAEVRTPAANASRCCSCRTACVIVGVWLHHH